MTHEDLKQLAALENEVYDECSRLLGQARWGGSNIPPQPENIRDPTGGMFFRAKIPRTDGTLAVSSNHRAAWQQAV